MNIAILTSAHPVFDIRVYYKQALSLKSACHRVTLIGPQDDRAIEVMAKVDIEYRPLLGRDKRINRVRQLGLILRRLNQTTFDAVHFHDPELLPLMIFWKWWFCKPAFLIYDVHEDVPKDILDKPWIPRPLRKAISIATDLVEGWGMKKCNLVIAATDSIAQRARRFTERVIAVRNYPIIDEKEFPFVKRGLRAPIRLIYAGNITEVRGLREVVKSMELLCDVDLELILLGELYPVEFRDEIYSMAGPNVKVMGKVSYEQSMEWMQKSDIGIVCFQPIPNHIEAMPNKIFEYMNAGLPVIASDFPLWKNIIEETGCGICVNPMDPTQIAAAVRKLVDNRALIEKMGQIGFRLVREKYSWQNEANTLIQAYNQLGKSYATIKRNNE